MDYVYTIAAAAARLRRGHKSVLIFLPNNGSLRKLTAANIALFKKEWKAKKGSFGNA